MKAALHASLHDVSWVDRLPWMMLVLRTAPKIFRPCLLNSFMVSPCRYPRSKISSREPRARGLLASKGQHSWRLRTSLCATMLTGALCSCPYDGSFCVLEQGVKFFVVDIGSKPDWISVDRLKPAHVDLDRPVVVAQPPWWGRPPAARSSSETVAPPPPAPADRSRCGRTLRPPCRLDSSVLVNSGGACVGAPNSSIIHLVRQSAAHASGNLCDVYCATVGFVLILATHVVDY